MTTVRQKALTDYIMTTGTEEVRQKKVSEYNMKQEELQNLAVTDCNKTTERSESSN